MVGAFRSCALGLPASLVRAARAREALLGLVALVTVAGLGFANGGYFPASWSWVALPLFALAAAALSRRSQPLAGGLGLAHLALLAAFAGWALLSAAWSSSVTASILEFERLLVYVAAATVVYVLARGGVRALLVGSWAAASIVSTYALATRLFPERLGEFDPIAGYRLFHPVGYWNALGLLAAMGTLLAVGLVARGGALLKPVAAASTVIFLSTLYFTFSRGAWVALFGALAVAIAYDRARLQLITAGLVLLPWPALAIFAAAHSPALTHVNTSIPAASRDGHGLAVILIGLTTGAVLSTLLYDALSERVRVRQSVRRAYGGTLAFLFTACAVALSGAYGAPWTLADKLWDSFKAPPPTSSVDLNERLFSFSGTGRIEHWRVAWDEYQEQPWLGSGAGTFDEYWFRDRASAITVHDAHNLYLETLAEAGPVGLALLFAWLAVPFAAAVRARGRPLASAALGAYSAYVLHAIVDWDWEMPALTLMALFCAAVLLVPDEPAESGEGAPKLRLPVRVGSLALVAAAGAFSLLALLGNTAVSESSKAARAGEWSRAAAKARDGRTWAPWSSQPWRRLGEAQLGAGDLPGARESFRRALAKDPRDWTLWYELALASRGAERRRAIAEALRLNPLSPEVAELR